MGKIKNPESCHPRGVLVHGYLVTKHPLYHIWNGMKQRCTYSRHVRYNRYGGRGITYCERWKRFINFANDMWPKPKGTTLERKDNNKGYNPDNCVWATPTQQRYNSKTRIDNKSGYTGIFVRNNGSFETMFTNKGKSYRLGTFKTLNEAINRRKKFVKLYEADNLQYLKLCINRTNPSLRRNSTTGIQGIHKYKDGYRISVKGKYLGFALTIKKAKQILKAAS